MSRKITNNLKHGDILTLNVEKLCSAANNLIILIHNALRDKNSDAYQTLTSKKITTDMVNYINEKISTHQYCSNYTRVDKSAFFNLSDFYGTII